MRAAQERGQGRLPPKKRELPVSASGGDGDEPGRSAERDSATAGEASSERPQAAAGKPGRAPSRYSEPGGDDTSDGDHSSETVASLTVDQCGFYKVAVPPTTFAPVVNVSPLPAAYGLTSQLLHQHRQHPVVPYPPIHYTQLPATPLQFVGSHYSLPYAVPHGFLPSHLLSSSAGLATSHVPHFVPYAPNLLSNDLSPSQVTHTFGKTSASVSPSGPLQPHIRGHLLDVSQGQIPIYYQMSHVPAGYSAFEAAVGLNSDQPLQEKQLDPKRFTMNGPQRSAVGAKESEAEGQWPRTVEEYSTSTPVLRMEVSVPSQPSTPDLEVQRVVGVLSEYPICSAQQKDNFSPLNLSHHNAAEQKEESGRNPVQVNAEKSHLQRLSAKSPEKQLCSRQTLKRLTLVNGKLVLGPLQPTVQEGLERVSPDIAPQEVQPETVFAHSQGHLPSHFMKGAIIQLATGELKRVEDLQTQDFVRSAEVSGGLKIDSSTVVDIQESPWQGFVMLHFVVGEQQSKVSIDVPPEHPFFVYGQGWSSCSPERTARLFSLPCHKLQVGDVCISISLQSLNGKLVPQSSSRGTIQEKPEQSGIILREPQSQVREKTPLQRTVGVLDLSQESYLEPISVYGWAGPSFQKLVEEPRLSLLRPSFIPQEVKLSIEGRSNAGK
ncbi:ataxin-1-like [Protobothrops mucrosquamatus]|uniref:ataxin-1-like n=1 Tax=Protobothrops mucrosquamatus TaxID=103944 RepID=UPI000775994F|nr:ataxin-1-like [Protobothrops mucrosquamatus]